MTDMHSTIDSNWRRLAAAVRQRRRVLGLLSLTAFAEVSGLSRRTISDLERAQRDNFDEATLGHLEAALGWASGSVQQILAGGEATEVAVEGRAQSTAARRLAGAVARRRGALGLSRQQLAAAAGLPLRTINAIEQANVILKPKPRARLAAALDWSDDDIAGILRTPEHAEHAEVVGRHVVPSIPPAAVGRAPGSAPGQAPADALEQLYGIFAELSDREQEHVLRAVHAVAGLARSVGAPETIDAAGGSNGRTRSKET